MKTQEQRLAERMAYRYLYRTTPYLNRKFQFDGRTRVGKMANQIVQVKIKAIDLVEISQKRKIRRQNKFTFSNILNNPIVKDYLNNKFYIRRIETNRIEFTGRNHWAKNETDNKILNCLIKYYKK